MSGSKEDILYYAKLAEQAERYDDMTNHMKDFVNMGNELSSEERNLLSVAYKNKVGQRRSSWRTITSIEEKEKNQRKSELLRDFRQSIEKEMREIC